MLRNISDRIHGKLKSLMLASMHRGQQRRSHRIGTRVQRQYRSAVSSRIEQIESRLLLTDSALSGLPATPFQILEDAPEQTIELTDIAGGGGGMQPLAITATSSNPALIPDPSIVYTSPNTTGSLSFMPVADQFGTAIITVVVTDGGPDNDLSTLDDNDSFTQTFEIEVAAVNDSPTLAAVTSASTTEEGGLQTISFSGITAGPSNEVQGTRVTAEVENSTVLIVPGGGDAAGRVITVNGVDFTYVTTPSVVTTDIVIYDVVTLVTVDSTTEVAEATAAAINAHFGTGTATAYQNTVNTRATITTTAPTLRVVAAPDILSNPTVNYTSGDDGGTITFFPLDDMFGVVRIRVTAWDDGFDGVPGTADDASISLFSNVVVSPVNDVPTLDALTNLYIPVSDGQQVINLTGISNGPGNELEEYRITVISGDTGVIPTPTLQHVSGSTTGTLTFTPVPGVSGASTITVMIEDAGIDGVFADPLTPQFEQADNRSIIRTFRVSTPPILTSPSGEITDTTPLISFTNIPGSAFYDVRLFNLTDNVAVDSGTGQTGANSFQVNTPLPLADYRVDVRATDVFGESGLWSTASTFTVAPKPEIVAPLVSRLRDSTPTIAWTSILGAESYSLVIQNDLTGATVYSATGLTSTQHTVPDANALALGRYRYTVSAVNLPAEDSTTGTVMSFVNGQVTISTPPELLSPPVAIYNRQPTITWSLPAEAAVSDVEIVDAVTGNVLFVQRQVTGSSYTLSAAQALADGEYQARVRSYADSGRTVASDFSEIQFFQVGSAPVLLGAADGGRRSTGPRPVLAFEGSLTGESYTVWLTRIGTDDEPIIARNVTSEGFSPNVDLPIGSYRYWVQATTGSQTSSWSRSYDFEVVTPPVIRQGDAATFDTQPLIQWDAVPNAASYRVWVNRTDVSPAVIQEITTVTENELRLTGPLTNGRYKVWVQATSATTSQSGRATTTNWSTPYSFEIGGRPEIVSASSTFDSTPSIVWRRVGLAASYEIFISRANAPLNAIIRANGITSTSYTTNVDLPADDYRVWVRAIGPDGQQTAWSLHSTSYLTVNAITRPVVSQIGTTGDRTPTFNWTGVNGAFRYHIYVAPVFGTSTPVINKSDVAVEFFTPQTPLLPGTYRVWVRAISGASEAGDWSVPVEFTLTSLDSNDVLRPDFVVASVATVVQTSDYAVRSNDEVSAETAVSDSLPKIVPDRQFHDQKSAEIIAAEHDAHAASAETDEVALGDIVMEDWDGVVMEIESARRDLVVADWIAADSVAADRQSDSAGMMAGFALLTPTVLRRRRRKQE